jgi:hypothetical protein
MGFRPLITKVWDFFAEHHWLENQADGYHPLVGAPPDPEPGDRARGIWPRALLAVTPARTIGEDSGVFFVSVRHMRWAWRNETLAHADFPLALQNAFLLCPNVVLLETHRKWYTAQREIGEELRNWLGHNGIATTVRSFEGDLTDAIRRAYLNPDDADRAIHELVLRALRGRTLPVLNADDLAPRFVNAVPDLAANTLEALRAAEFLWTTYPRDLDWSPIVIEYCKALEIEISERLLHPVRSALRGANLVGAERKAGPAGRLYRYLSGQSPVPPELGSLAISLEAALTSTLPGGIAEELQLQLARFPQPTWAREGFLLELRHLTQVRNAAAHDRLVSYDDAAACRGMVVGSADRDGLLTRLVLAESL